MPLCFSGKKIYIYIYVLDVFSYIDWLINELVSSSD